jgi:hypothetical protein
MDEITYDWYKIFNKTEFEALGLVSRMYSLVLEEIGLKEILVTKSNYLSLTYEGIFLSLAVNDKNPFEFEGHAIYLDDNNDVFLGIEVES